MKIRALNRALAGFIQTILRRLKINILLVSHQLDYSGAPIALLQFAKSLLRQQHIVYLVSLQDGPLASEFWEAGVNKYDSSKCTADDYDLVIANTVLSIPSSINFVKNTEKLLAWIHEAEYFFDVIGLSPQNFLLNELKYTAFPAKFQMQEFEKWMPLAKKFQLRNCIDIPKEVYNYESDKPYLICSGHWEKRKSQVTLVNLLKNVDNYPEVKFLGADKPLGLIDGNFSFTGMITPVEAKFQIAGSRGVISCALSEVQPLVAIEAMFLRVPLMLSDIPAHRELKELVPDILLFDPLNVDSFCYAFQALLNQWSDKNARDRLRVQAIKAFGIEQFDRNVAVLINFLSRNIRPG